MKEGRSIDARTDLRRQLSPRASVANSVPVDKSERVRRVADADAIELDTQNEETQTPHPQREIPNWKSADLQDGGGQANPTRMTWRDLTEYPDGNAESPGSQEQHQILSELTSDYRYSAVVHVSGKMGINWLSGSTKGIAGYPVEEILALKYGWYELVHPNDQHDFSTWWLRTLANETVAHEYRILAKSGEVRWLRDYRKPVWSATEGRVTLIWGAIQDVTQRKQVEETLVQRVAELQARNEELDAFAHTVSHDLRNPLGLILGYANLLADDLAPLPNEDLQSYIAVIERAARKMDHMMSDLLLLAGIGSVDVRIGPLDMAGILSSVSSILSRMIEEYEANIVLPTTWPVAEGYGPWIEVVWSNYLSNAMKYGGKPPKIELGATIEQEGMVRFWVRDNGRGLTPHDQSRLFVPFTRLAPATVDGNGVGLSIVQRIIRRLGGQTHIESEAGQGSIFSFSLPYVAV